MGTSDLVLGLQVRAVHHAWYNVLKTILHEIVE